MCEGVRMVPEAKVTDNENGCLKVKERNISRHKKAAKIVPREVNRRYFCVIV